MSRVEVIGDAQLHLGDCLQILPTLSGIQSVISDPPFENELHNAMGRIRRNDGRTMVDELGFDGVNDQRSEIAQAVVNASSGWVILFTLAEGVRAWRDDLQAAGAKWDTTLAWVKPDASPRFNGQGAARGFECAVTCWAGTGYRSWNGGGKRGVYVHCVNGPNRQGEHPTEKPLSLMMELVADFTQPGDLVCDPFAGSFTTALACLKLGRKFVGIEQNERWFNLGLRRIDEFHRQGSLFDVQKKPVQPHFFKSTP